MRDRHLGDLHATLETPDLTLGSTAIQLPVTEHTERKHMVAQILESLPPTG